MNNTMRRPTEKIIRFLAGDRTSLLNLMDQEITKPGRVIKSRTMKCPVGGPYTGEIVYLEEK